jgi:nicotinamidase-related amidase/type 1 glutamine amidotransferase
MSHEASGHPSGDSTVETSGDIWGATSREASLETCPAGRHNGVAWRDGADATSACLTILTRCPMAVGLLIRRPVPWCVALGALSWCVAWGAEAQAPPPQDDVLTLHARTRVETSPGSGRYHAVLKTLQWDPRRTAIVVCDMWDKHWCRSAARRVAEMAPRMNEVLSAARKRGVLVIHCPSNTMDHYRGHPGRELAQQAPAVPTEIPLQRWCYLDRQREPALPIDDRDNGCDCQPQCESYRAWTRQIDTLRIEPGDAITDSAEAFYLMKQRGITNVIVLGVHTNMCVLGRPFSIRQMVYQGQNVVLMRDMTDTMYNPRSAPYVSHFTGTDLVVEHIERHWCPTITSVDFLGGKEFRFSDDRRPHLAIVMAEDEYRTETTLPRFALEHLGHDFRCTMVYGSDTQRHDIPGLEVLQEADLALLSIRRRVLPPAQMQHVRAFVAAGKPLVAMRTSSHAFALRDAAPEGYEQWPEFDREVLGCRYAGHHPNNDPKQPRTFVWVAPQASSHPVVRGLRSEEFAVVSSLYRSLPLAQGTTPLLWGRFADAQPHEPVAWLYRRPDGGRVFYTSLGHEEDFRIPDFVRLLRNGVYWAAGLSVPTDAAPASRPSEP